MNIQSVVSTKYPDQLGLRLLDVKVLLTPTPSLLLSVSRSPPVRNPCCEGLRRGFMTFPWAVMCVKIQRYF